MRRRGAAGWLAAIAVLLLLSGCERPRFLSDGAPDLQALSNRLGAGYGVFFEQLGYRVLSAGTGDDAVELSVRRLGDHWTPIGEAEQAKLKQAIYKKVGYKFGLKLEPFALSEQGAAGGYIAGIDGSRVLVVGRAKPGSEATPPARWFDYGGKDAKLYAKDGGRALTVAELKIGQRVDAWSEPLVLTSYPEQSSGLELRVTDEAIGEPDVAGRVTDIQRNAATGGGSLAVDGRRVLLTFVTPYIVNGAAESIEKLNVGDEIEVRYSGDRSDSGDPYAAILTLRK